MRDKDKAANPASPDEWISLDEALRHISACIWHKADRPLALQLTISMVARARLQEALAEGLVRARGPLRWPLRRPAYLAASPPEPFWPVRDVPADFWRNANWDGLNGFENVKTLEKLPWIEVPKDELLAIWPSKDCKALPAPFDRDRIAFRDAVEALKRRLELRHDFAEYRLSDAISQGKIRVFDAKDESEASAELYTEELIALWPDLVMYADGSIAASSPTFVDKTEEEAAKSDPAAPQVSPDALDVRQQKIHPIKHRKLTKPEAIAKHLREIYPDERPGKLVEEINRDLDSKFSAVLGKFSTRTFQRALAIAWPEEQEDCGLPPDSANRRQ